MTTTDSLVVVAAASLLLAHCGQTSLFRTVSPGATATLEIKATGAYLGPIQVGVRQDDDTVVIWKERGEWHLLAVSAVWTPDSDKVAVVACNGLGGPPVVAGYSFNEKRLLERSEVEQLWSTQLSDPDGSATDENLAEWCKEQKRKFIDDLPNRLGRSGQDRKL